VVAVPLGAVGFNRCCVIARLLVDLLSFFEGITSSRMDFGGRHKESVENITYSRPIPRRGGKISIEMTVEHVGGNCFL
jgi:hypothetical protein